MMSKQNVPELRFPEFSGEWKEAVTEEHFTSIRNGFVGTATPFYTNSSGVKYLQSNNIKNGQINNKQIVYVTREFHEKYIKNELRVNDMLMVQSGHAGETAIVNKEYEGANCHALIVMKPKDTLDTHYLNYYFQTYNGRKEIYKLITGNTIKHILASDAKKIKFPLPSLKEQRKISNFFRQIDRLIELEEKKLELLEEQKKGYVQKIFSQELRFKDENGNDYPEWEEKSFSEILEVMSGKDYKHLNKGEYPVYGTGGYMTSVDNFLYKQDAIGIGRKGTIDKPQYLKGPFWTVDTLFYCIPQNRIDISFLYYLFNQINWKKFDESTGVPSLSKNTIYKVKVKTPCFKEQQRIGDFFVRFNKMINLQNEKIVKLNKEKQGLLQKMFV